MRDVMKTQKDYSILKVLYYLLGIKADSKPIKIEELFDIKNCQIYRYKVLSPIRLNGELWQVPLDKIPFSVLRIPANQIIFVRDDLKKNYVDINYMYNNTEETASVDRKIFNKIIPSLKLLPPTKFRGGLGETVKEISRYYKLNKNEKN